MFYNPEMLHILCLFYFVSMCIHLQIPKSFYKQQTCNQFTQNATEIIFAVWWRPSQFWLSFSLELPDLTSIYLYSYFHPPAFVQLMSSAARQLQRSLETCVFHTASWRELHPHDGRPDEARSHPAACQRHKGTHFWGLCLTSLGGQTSVPRWEEGLVVLINSTVSLYNLCAY